MVIVRRKIGLFQVIESWNGVLLNLGSKGFFASFNNIRDHQQVPFYWVRIKSRTIENDLSAGEAEILAKFSKQVRNCIRQAIRIGVQCTISKDGTRFLELYNEFALRKDLPPVTPAQIAAIGDNAYFSYAWLEGKLVAAHFYIIDFASRYAMLYRSGSLRLNRESLSSNTIGKANKYLHYSDMLHFKSMGMLKYEFGGFDWSDDSCHLYGINRFKYYFGGEIVDYNRYETIPYFVIRRFRKMMSAVKESLR